MLEPEVLYEDNHVLVAVKPANLLSQADDTGDPDMLSLLKEYVRVKYEKPGAVYLGLVHRLDRPVGGLMVFARTSKAASRLVPQLQQHAMGREYLCVAQGSLPERFDREDWLKKDERTNTVTVCPAGTPGAKRAVLHGRVLRREGTLCLCAIRLETGRSHQIRVQMAHAGAPLWGDARYGGGRPGQPIALFGYRLSFEHPTTHQIMRFERLPQGGIWERCGVNALSSRKNGEDNGEGAVEIVTTGHL